MILIVIRLYNRLVILVYSVSSTSVVWRIMSSCHLSSLMPCQKTGQMKTELRTLLLCQIFKMFQCFKRSHLSRHMTKPTKWLCTHRRLRSAWAFMQTDQSSLCAEWVVKDPSFLHAYSKDSNQTGQMPRLIWVFFGSTCIFLVLSCSGHIYQLLSQLFEPCHEIMVLFVFHKLIF